MKALNVVVVSGRLGKVPELAYFSDRTPSARFSLAVDRPVKRGDTWVTESDWIDFQAVGQKATVIAEHCNVGDELIVEGHLAVNQWTDRRGDKRSSVYVRVGDVMFGRRARQETRHEREAAREPASPDVQERVTAAAAPHPAHDVVDTMDDAKLFTG